MKRQKVIKSERTLLRWENMFDVTLACGHMAVVQMIKGKCPATATCRKCS